MFFKKYYDKRDGAIRGYDMHSRSSRVLSVLIMLMCVVMVMIALFPIVWVFLAAFKDIKDFNTNVSLLPSHFDFAGVAKTWGQLKFSKFYVNSIILVVGSVFCAILFNGLLAYGLAVLKPKGYKVIQALVMWSLLIPSTASIVALFRNINMLGMSRSFLPLWLAYGANAFWVVLFKEFFEELPTELLEAARLDGCGTLQVFLKMVLPLSKPIIMVVAIFAVTTSWSDFLLPYLVLNGSGKETVMVKLFSFKDTPTNAVAMLRAVMFSIIPPTILFVLFQKQITDGAAAGAVKG
ncbi:MAG: carbohydrate ABC transporter permease [Lachnospiraceae bacterium]|nr:carbohydrate ABC transporter permease [Lachnospiraceae bacterium]